MDGQRYARCPFLLKERTHSDLGIDRGESILLPKHGKTMPTPTRKLSVRLSPNQMVVLSELSTALKVSISVLLRAIVLDFLTRNEQRLDRIIDGQTAITDISQLHDAND